MKVNGVSLVETIVKVVLLSSDGVWIKSYKYIRLSSRLNKINWKNIMIRMFTSFLLLGSLIAQTAPNPEPGVMTTFASESILSNMSHEVRPAGHATQT